jgi:AcrR family transcriptional regulator
VPKLVDHDVRKDQIAEAAGRVMAVQGLEALTLRDIAREDGCSPGILTHYFRDRTEILAHASRHLGEATLRRQLDSLADAESIEEAFVRELPLEGAIREEWKTRFQLWARSAVDAELADAETHSLKQWRGAIVELLLERGVLPPASEPDVIADHMLALSIGLCVCSFFDPSGFDAERVAGVVRNATRTDSP